MTMITPSYLGETIEYSSLHACRSTLEDPKMLLNKPRMGSPSEGSLGHVVVSHLAYSYLFCHLLRKERKRGVFTGPQEKSR